MSSLRDSILDLIFSNIFFLNPKNASSTVFISFSCCMQLWCHIWAILSLFDDTPETLMAKDRTYLSSLFIFTNLSNSILNIVISVQWMFSRFGENCKSLAPFQSKEKLFLEAVTYIWIVLDLYKLYHLSFHYLKQNSSITVILIAYSYSYLVLRIEMTVLYLVLKIENLAMHCAALNMKLKLWLPLNRVVNINTEHHKLINEIQEIFRLTGSTTLIFCLRCVVTILINIYILIFIKWQETTLTLPAWYRIKHIATYFVSITFKAVL